MQYQLVRSPRSKPMVGFCPAIFSIVDVTAVLIYFIAGLLYLLRFERVDNLGAYSIPSETGFSSVLITTVIEIKRPGIGTVDERLL